MDRAGLGQTFKARISGAGEENADAALGVAPRVLRNGYLVTRVSGERLIKRIKQPDGYEPKDDLGRDALLFDDLFVKTFVFFAQCSELLCRLDAGRTIIAGLR